MEENELYTLVRGIKVPTIQIKQIEEQFGVKLVSDDYENANIIYTLDRTLAQYRLENKRDPDLILLTDTPDVYYKHMVMNLNFLGMEVPGSYTKPAWFKLPRSHRI